MIRPLPRRLLLATVFASSWSALGHAADAPASGAAATDQKLHDAMARPGGLTSAEVGKRAASTSPDARAKDYEVDAAEAEVDKAVSSYFPRLTFTARYTRLSPISPPVLGVPGFYSVATTRAPSAAPLTPGTDPLFATPAFSFPVILDQYLLQANLVVPLTDYLLRIAPTHSATKRARDAARLSAQASRLSPAAHPKVAYLGLGQAVLQGGVAEAAPRRDDVLLACRRAGHSDIGVGRRQL